MGTFGVWDLADCLRAIFLVLLALLYRTSVRLFTPTVLSVRDILPLVVLIVHLHHADKLWVLLQLF